MPQVQTPATLHKKPPPVRIMLTRSIRVYVQGVVSVTVVSKTTNGVVAGILLLRTSVEPTPGHHKLSR